MMIRSSRTLFLATLAIFLPVLAFAQAWVPPKGTGSVAISYLNDFDDKEFFGHGENYIINPDTGVKQYDFGTVRTQGVYFDLSYSFTNKLGFTLSIPYLAPKWTAPAIEGDAQFAAHVFADGTIPLDDGHYHGSFQDFAFRLRYNVITAPLVFTPFVEYNLPSHEYLFFSHAVVGRHVNSAGFGTYLAGSLDRILPNTYIQGRYSLDFDQEILGYSRHHNNMELEVGNFLTTRFRAFGILAAQVTNGGINIPDNIPPTAFDSTDPIYFHHAQISRDNDLEIGIGEQYSLNNSIDIYGLVQHMITARNLHALKYGISFGMSWGFGGPPQRPCHC